MVLTPFYRNKAPNCLANKKDIGKNYFVTSNKRGTFIMKTNLKTFIRIPESSGRLQIMLFQCGAETNVTDIAVEGTCLAGITLTDKINRHFSESHTSSTHTTHSANCQPFVPSSAESLIFFPFPTAETGVYSLLQ